MRWRRRLFAPLVVFPCWATGLVANPVRQWKQDIALGWKARVAADPNFQIKSAAEILLAAGTQLSAEWNRRGDSLLPEIDFVVAGILTAIAGKYFSMWKVARTKDDDASSPKQLAVLREPTVFDIVVPTNAFQKTMMDGVTPPSLTQRIGSFVAPMAALFKAGIVSSLFGYGLTALFIQLRTVFVPAYVSVTQNINVMYASLYTGAFLALVSNVRYQILQGLIEPWIDLALGRLPLLRGVFTFAVRVANGILGSLLSITGMRWVGLQRLK